MISQAVLRSDDSIRINRNPFPKDIWYSCCIFKKGFMLISSVIASPCSRLMHSISQALKNMVNYKKRDLVLAPVSPSAAYFCTAPAVGANNANNAGSRFSAYSVASGQPLSGSESKSDAENTASPAESSTSEMRMILAPDNTMVPDHTVRQVHVRVKLYDNSHYDDPRFPRTTIPMPRPGSKSESVSDLDFGYEPAPEIAGATASSVSAGHPVTVSDSRGSLQNKAASDLNAEGVTKSPQTREQSLERIKFLIATEDSRVKILNSNEEALGRLMNKSGIALFGIENSCEETYKDVYSTHFDAAYEKEMSGDKSHAEILRSAHMHADQTAQAYLLGLDKDVDANTYGKFLLAQSFQTDVSRCRNYCRAVNLHSFAKTLRVSGFELSQKMDAMEAVYLKSYNDTFWFFCEKNSEEVFSAGILRQAHNLANDAALGDIKALESEDGETYADAWAHFTMSFGANGMPANYALRSGKFAPRVLQPVPSGVDRETRL